MTDVYVSPASIALQGAVETLEKVVAQLRERVAPELEAQENSMSEDALARELPLLTVALNDLTAASVADSRKRDRQVRTLMSIVGVLCAVLLMVVSLQREFLHGRAQSREAVKNTSQIVQVIRDCTDPAGKCYQQSQATVSAANVVLIHQLEAAVKEVARCKYYPESDFDACVDQAFAKLDIPK